jgi:prophage regulatory protein
MFNNHQKGVHMYHTILRLDLVKRRTGLSRSSIYKAVKDGTFPRPIVLGPRSVGWLDASIEAWIQFRIELSTRTGGQS